MTSLAETCSSSWLSGLPSSRFWRSSFVFQAAFRIPLRDMWYFVGKNDQKLPRPTGTVCRRSAFTE